MKKLFAASIPITFLLAVHEALIRNRRGLEGMVKAARNEETKGDPSIDKFGGQRSTRTQQQNKDGITCQEEELHLPDNDQFSDKGIYSASRELHMLSACFTSSGDSRETMIAAAQGRSTFESRELSSAVPERERRGPQESTAGPSNFTSSDVAEQTPLVAPGLAKTPEEIRRKVRTPEPEPEPERPTGKETSASKDIEPIAPQEAPRKRVQPKPNAEPEPAPQPERPSGKAVFESRDLSSDSPTEND